MSDSSFVITMLGAGALFIVVSLFYSKVVLRTVSPGHPLNRLLRSLLLILATCGIAAIAVGVLYFFFLMG